MDETNKKGFIDLGSDGNPDFDPFPDDDDFLDDGAEGAPAPAPAAAQAQPTSGTRAQAQALPNAAQAKAVSTAGIAPDGAVNDDGAGSSADVVDNNDSDDTVDVANDDVVGDNPRPGTDGDNPLENAIGAAETKDAEKARQSLYEKPPVFEFAGAAEDIKDSSQTFDELRIAKAADFPELEDGKRVSWTVEYGKITKTVADAKGTSIAKMKSDIETSKEFLDALKKAKDKNPACKVKPRVTAQSKGTASSTLSSTSVSVSGYKGVFTNMNDVDAADKTISVLPARDGQVYEIRNNALGRFITPVIGSDMLSDVKAGFIPAKGIPRIPMDLTMKIISFFRHFARKGEGSEVLVNVYWDKEDKEFVIDTPEQIVSKVSVHSTENPDYIGERYIHFMDIHSHNNMRAFFSSVDDRDEKATRLYTVIGRLECYFPEIKTRISNGGKFHEIDPSEVFEYIDLPFPEGWKESVSLRAPHKDVSHKDVLYNDIINNGISCYIDSFSKNVNENDVPWYTDDDDAPHNTGGDFI